LVLIPAGYDPQVQRAASEEVTTRVLLADDDVELSELLAEYLRRDGFAVDTVHDGKAAVSRALSAEYGMVVLDITMPLMDGIEALRRIRATSVVPVLILTARGDDIDRIVGLELGADDYVPKPCTPRELAARLRAIGRRLAEPRPIDELATGALRMWPQRRRAEWSGSQLELTSAEFSILEVLLRNAGRVVEKTQLCRLALGRPLERFDRSIDVHLSSIRHKLGEGSELIHTVRRLGYLLEKR